MEQEARPTPIDILVIVIVLVGVGLITWRFLLITVVDLDGRPYCKSNMNALAKSALVYCEQNRGYLMAYTDVTVPGTEWTEAAPSADQTAVCFATGKVDPSSSLLVDARNYGRVFTATLLGPAQLFYCPDQRQRPHLLKDYPQPWGSAVAKGAEFIFCGYMYNPWVKRATAEGKQFVYEDGLVLTRHPFERFISSDLITGPQTIAHREGNMAFWNAGFIDGHVESLRVRPLEDTFTDNPQTDWNSWDHWGAASADGMEPGPGTVRYELLKALLEPSPASAAAR